MGILDLFKQNKLGADITATSLADFVGALVADWSRQIVLKNSKTDFLGQFSGSV
jgi:hypothetical protein